MTYLVNYCRSDNALAVPAARHHHRAKAWCDILVYVDGDAYASSTVVLVHDEGAPMVTGGDLAEIGAIAAYTVLSEA